MKVRVLVSFKDSVLDPQGQTVKNALHTLGYDFVKDVRQGKVFELEMAEMTREEAEKQARQDIMSFQVERLKLQRKTQSDLSQLATRINIRRLPKVSD